MKTLNEEIKRIRSIMGIIVEHESMDGFKYVETLPWTEEGAKHEWNEEIKLSLNEKDIPLRWPGMSEEIIEEKYPYLLSPNSFADALTNAPIQNLSLLEMKEIYNLSAVNDIIKIYEKGGTPQDVYDDSLEFFKGLDTQTDADAEGKTYSKDSSYNRWVKKFKEEEEIDVAPVVIILPDGSLAHIAGQTRQTGALTNKKILPYIILEPVQ
jgi:hypothetical protein